MLTLKSLLVCAVSYSRVQQHINHPVTCFASRKVVPFQQYLFHLPTNMSTSVPSLPVFCFILTVFVVLTCSPYLSNLVDTLGARLEGEGTEKRCLQACLCYICSGNIEKLVECWALQRDCSSPLVLEV